MTFKAIRLEGSQDESLRVLNEILGERRASVTVSPSKIAAAINLSEGAVRYHLKKLVRDGYLEQFGKEYRPTGKVLFLQTKN